MANAFPTYIHRYLRQPQYKRPKPPSCGYLKLAKKYFTMGLKPEKAGFKPTLPGANSLPLKAFLIMDICKAVVFKE